MLSRGWSFSRGLDKNATPLSKGLTQTLRVHLPGHRQFLKIRTPRDGWRRTSSWSYSTPYMTSNAIESLSEDATATPCKQSETSETRFTKSISSESCSEETWKAVPVKAVPSKPGMMCIQREQNTTEACSKIVTARRSNSLANNDGVCRGFERKPWDGHSKTGKLSDTRI